VALSLALGAGTLVAVGAAAPTAAAATLVCAAEQPNDAGAAATARACGRRVEITGRRTPTRTFLANPDGTLTVEMTQAPIRMRSASGAWIPVDLTFERRLDGSVAPRAHPGALTLAGARAGGDGELVAVGDGDNRISLGWRGRLPAPALQGNIATYVDVLPGIDIVIKALRTGFEQNLVIKTRAAAGAVTAVRMPWRTGTLAARARSDGSVALTAARGRPAAEVPAAVMWDATLTPRSGLPARTAPVAMSLAGSDLVLTPSRAFLDDPATVYPVTVDPIINPAPAYDAFVQTGYASDQSGLDELRLGYSDDGGPWTARSYMRWDNLSSFWNTTVISATLSLWEWWSWSCSPAQWEAWRVDYVSTATRWTNQPVWRQQAGYTSQTKGHDSGCSPGWVAVGVVNPFQTSFTNHYNTANLGLRATTETSHNGWKRFDSSEGTHPPVVSITINHKPGTPTGLSPTSDGSAPCNTTIGTTSTALRAKYVDADTSDTLTAVFEYKLLPSGNPVQVPGVPKAANNYGTTNTTVTLANGNSYSFRVQTNDGHDSSPWSSWCNFTVVSGKPKAPTVTSADYPADNVAHGGPGVSGTFTFGPDPTDPLAGSITSYDYGWINPPTNNVPVPAGATTSPIALTPPQYGLNTLYVLARTSAGTPGTTRQYQFLVGSPGAAVDRYPMDPFTLWNDLQGGIALSPGSGVGLTPSLRFIGFDSVDFSGSSTSAATAPVPNFDTSGSFSVSAWVRVPSTTCSGNATAVSIDGSSTTGNNYTSGLFLGLDCTTKKWKFRVPATNTGFPSTTEANSGTVATAGRWTHLAGVWDEKEKRTRLWVDGVAVETVPTSTWLTARGSGWKATGPLALGRDRYNSTDGGRFTGQIADVVLHNRVVVGDDLWGSSADDATGKPDHDGLLQPVNVGSWTFPGAGTVVQQDSADGAPLGGRPVRLDPHWTDAPAPSSYTMDDHDGNQGAASFDGRAGYAATTDFGSLPDSTTDDVQYPVMRTDQSLTMAAWVRVRAATGADQVVLRQGAGSTSAAKLMLRASDGKWVFQVTTPNGTGYTNTAAVSNNLASIDNEWVHLIGVFDAATGEVRLYIGGELQPTHPSGAAGWHSTNSLLLGVGGAGGYLAGDIDEVQIYAGAMSDREAFALFDTHS
jgi:hypothetical protein